MHPELEFRAAQVHFDDLRREAAEHRRHDLGLRRRRWWRRTPVEATSPATETPGQSGEVPVRGAEVPSEGTALPAPAARIPGQRAPEVEREPTPHST